MKLNKSNPVMPLIILEGPDSTGKTTLAKVLTKHLHGIYWHTSGRGKLIGPAMQDYLMDIAANVQVNLCNRTPVVLDRHWPSEYAYSRALGRPTVSLINISEYMNSLGAVYIYCFSENAEERQANDPDPAHIYDERQYRRITLEYLKLYDMAKTSVPCALYRPEYHGHDLIKFWEEQVLHLLP